MSEVGISEAAGPAGTDLTVPTEEKAFRTDGWTACMAAFDAQFNQISVQHCPHFSLRQCHNATCVKPHVKPPDESLKAFIAAWPVASKQKKKKTKQKPNKPPLGGVKSVISKLPEALQARVLLQRAALRASARLSSRPQVQLPPVQLPPVQLMPLQEMMVQVPMSRMQYLEQLERQFALEQQSRQQAEAGWQQCEAAAVAQQQQHDVALKNERQQRLQAEKELRRLRQTMQGPPSFASASAHSSHPTQHTARQTQKLVHSSTPHQPYSQPIMHQLPQHQPMQRQIPQSMPLAEAPTVPEARELRPDGWTACVAAFDAHFNPFIVQYCPHFSLRQCNNAACAKPHVKPPDALLQSFVAAWPIVHKQKKKKQKRPRSPQLVGQGPTTEKLGAQQPGMLPTMLPLTAGCINFGFNAATYGPRYEEQQLAQQYPH